jgi:hypothetical protein
VLVITVPATKPVELWDESKQEFVMKQGTKEQTLQLEHSLVSLSKWESKWCRPFLSKPPATAEETIDYIQCMTLTKNVNPEVYSHLTQENIDEIKTYINAPMTATTFSKDSPGKRNTEIITAELIYYWMISLQIPVVECQKWHINRLLTLIRVCNVKNQPPKKRSQREIMNRNAALNAARRKQLNTNG